MKALNMLTRLKRVQVVKWGRRIGCSTGGSAAVCFRRREEMECHGSGGGGGGGGSYLLRQLICRFKSQWKQALRRERSSTSSGLYSYAYDIQSYSQNFDDGNCLDEHLSPLAPR